MAVTEYRNHASYNPILDQAASAVLGQLWLDHADPVRAHVQRKVRCPEVAEDITSQVFLEAASHLCRDRTAKITVQWLICVAGRRVIDSYRSNGRQRTFQRRLEAEFCTPRATNMFDSVDADAALAALSDRDRASLRARYVDGYSVADVANRLGVTYRAAESSIARARRRFRDAYQPS